MPISETAGTLTFDEKLRSQSDGRSCWSHVHTHVYPTTCRRSAAGISGERDTHDSVAGVWREDLDGKTEKRFEKRTDDSMAGGVGPPRQQAWFYTPMNARAHGVLSRCPSSCSIEFAPAGLGGRERHAGHGTQVECRGGFERRVGVESDNCGHARELPVSGEGPRHYPRLCLVLHEV